MPLPVFKSRDEIPEAFREEYEERNGEWHPKDVAGSALKSALEKERERAQKAHEKLTQLEATVRELTLKAQAQNHGLTDEQLAAVREDVKKEMDGEYGEKLTELQQKLEATSQEAAKGRDGLKALKVQQLLLDKGARSKRVEALYKLTAEEWDLTPDGTVIIKGKPGNDVAKHAGDTLKKAFPEFYEGTGADGGGAGGINDGGTHPQISAEDGLKNPEALLAAAHAGKA